MVEGRAGMDFGEITPSGYPSSLTVSHKLGTSPRMAYLVRKDGTRDSNNCVSGVVVQIDGQLVIGNVYDNHNSPVYEPYDKANANICSISKSSTQITFSLYTGTFYSPQTYEGTYYWFAIA